MMDRSQREGERKDLRTRYTLQRNVPSDLLPPAKLHLLIAHSTMNSSMD
jgi:hypothetical protein